MKHSIVTTIHDVWFVVSSFPPSEIKATLFRFILAAVLAQALAWPVRAQLAISDEGDVTIGQANDQSNLTVHGAINPSGNPVTIGRQNTPSTLLVFGSIATRKDLEVDGKIKGYGTVPLGAVIDWWRPRGTHLQMPDNFKICDGSQVFDAESPYFGYRVPDLRRRFILGAENEDQIGVTGGRSTNTGTNNYISFDRWEAMGQTGAIPSQKPPADANQSAGLIQDKVPRSPGEWRFALSSSDVGKNDGQHVHSDNLPPFYGLLKIIRIK